MSSELAERVLKLARDERDYVTDLVRDLIRIPSPSCGEDKAANRLKDELESFRLDEVFVDSIGNVVGRYGTGRRVILYDSHMDTVGVGDRSAWKVDPFEARMEDGVIYGRGASDNKAGLACMVAGLRILSALGRAADFSLYVVGIVQEEVCEGLALSVLIEERGLSPECVVLSECTNLGIYRSRDERSSGDHNCR